MNPQNASPLATGQQATEKAHESARQVPPITVNYYRLLAWFWEEVPFMPDYKSHYGCTFLAIADSINRNSHKDMWRETAIDFGQLINKVGCSKPMYYKALKWLSRQQLITYLPGRNAHSMARFHIGSAFFVEVNKLTSGNPSTHKAEVNKLTSINTSTDEVEVNKLTSDSSSGSTSSLPINKDIPNTYIPDTNSLPVVPTFDEFWHVYDKKLDKVKSQKIWDKLTDQDKLDIMAVLPAYVLATGGERYQYRKHPSTFLTSQSWKDEDIGKSRSPAQPTASPNAPVTNRPQPTRAPKGLAIINKP